MAEYHGHHHRVCRTSDVCVFHFDVKMLQKKLKNKLNTIFASIWPFKKIVPLSSTKDGENLNICRGEADPRPKLNKVVAKSFENSVVSPRLLGVCKV